MKKTMRNKFKKFVPFVTIGALFPIVFSFVSSIDNQHVNKIDNSYNAAKEATTYNSINSFNDYQTIANESTMQSISTLQGFFGKTNDNKTVVLTSYDGIIVWEDRIVNNSDVVNYYKQKGINDISAYKMHSWAYTEIGTNKLLCVLFGDQSNKNMTVFAYSIFDGRLFGGQDNRFTKIVDVKDGSTTLNRLSNGNVVASKYGKEKDVKYTRTVVTINNNGLSQIYAVSDLIDNTLGATDDERAKYNEATFLYFSSGKFESNTNVAVFLRSDNKYFTIAIDDSLIPLRNNGTNIVKYDSSVTFTADTNGIYKSINDIPKYGFTLNQDSSSFFTLNLIGGSTEDKTIFLNLNARVLSEKAWLNHNGNKFRYSNYDFSNNSLYISYYKSPDRTRVIKWDLNKDTTGNASTANIPVDDTSNTEQIANPFLIAPVVSSKKYNFTPYVYVSDKQDDVPTAVFESGQYLAKFKIQFNKWYDPVAAFKGDTALYKNKIPSNVNNNELVGKLRFNSGSNSIGTYRVSIQNKSANDDYGTLSATYKVDSTNWWDRTTSSTFTIPFYVDGMYKKSNINFSFVTNKINATIDKFNKIEELKRTKYAKDITKKEVLDNFFVYNIKDKGDNKFTITENMITLTPVGNVLRVRVTLPVNSFPSGTPGNLLNYTYEFTGFKDTSGYTFHFLTNDEQNKSDNVKLLKSSKYPSEIEYDSKTMILTDNGKRDLFNNFIQLGFSYNANYSSWEVKLKSVDNVNGTLVIDYIKYVDTSVGADFPEELKNVLGNTTLTEFKKLTDNFKTPPKMIKYVGNLTPPGLWNEYQTLLNNGNPEQSTLIKSLTYGLANPKNLDIKVTNLGTSTKDKKLNLEISLKDDAITNLIVNGKYLTLDKQTNDSLKKSLNDVYPYNVTWEIDSQSYVFEWDTNNNKEGVTETDNSLSIDIEKAKYDFMNSDMYVDEVKDQDLLSLFTLQNYEISKSPEISRNRAAGTITIVFSINQVDPGQGQTRVAIYNDGSDSISDNQKIIFIKNFKIPFSPVTQYIPAIILSIALVVLVLIIMMLITKSRTSVIENPLSRKRKKFKKLTRIKK